MLANNPLFNAKYYLSGAMVIGVMQVMDALTAISDIRGSLAIAFSLLELCWFFVSLLFLTIFYQRKHKLLVPGLYCFFYVGSYFHASYLLILDTSNVGLVLPTWYLYSAGFFGVIYCSSAWYGYRQLLLIEK